MLVIRCDADFRLQLDNKGQYDIVGVDTGLVQKVVFVDVLTGTE